jgi:hypothetical protein
MSLNNIINEFQNYSYNDSISISEYLNNLNNNNSLDTEKLEIREFLLHEILILLNKSILNRFSTDVLFQNNYWSWGIVSLYYSNYFLSQALNRLKGNFFVQIPTLGKRNIKLENGLYKLYKSVPKNEHRGESKKFQDNYTFLLVNSTENSKYLRAILDIKESEIRNIVNYQLKHYREFSFNEFKQGVDFNQCHSEYKNYIINDTENEEFKLLGINNDKFNLIFNILNEIENTNENFKSKFILVKNKLKNESSYKFTYSTLRVLENKLNTNMRFHTISDILEKQIKGLLT